MTDRDHRLVDQTLSEVEARFAAEDREDRRRERVGRKAGTPRQKRDIRTFDAFASGGVVSRRAHHSAVDGGCARLEGRTDADDAHGPNGASSGDPTLPERPLRGGATT